MAHWGVAMSIWHQLWNEPDAKVIARGLEESNTASKLAEKATAREKSYIAAITAFYSDSEKSDHAARAKAYSDGMKKVYEANPDDHEAAAFYALSLLASEPHHDDTFANRLAAAAILEPLFASEPESSRSRALPDPRLRQAAVGATRHPRRSPLRPSRSRRASRPAHALAHLRPRRPLARRHQLQPGLRRRHPQDRRHAHGRRRPPVPRHGLPRLRLPAKRTRSRRPEDHRRSQSHAPDARHVRHGLRSAHLRSQRLPRNLQSGTAPLGRRRRSHSRRRRIHWRPSRDLLGPRHRRRAQR